MPLVDLSHLPCAVAWLAFKAGQALSRQVTAAWLQATGAGLQSGPPTARTLTITQSRRTSRLSSTSNVEKAEDFETASASATRPPETEGKGQELTNLNSKEAPQLNYNMALPLVAPNSEEMDGNAASSGLLGAPMQSQSQQQQVQAAAPLLEGSIGANSGKRIRSLAPPDTSRGPHGQTPELGPLEEEDSKRSELALWQGPRVFAGSLVPTWAGLGLAWMGQLRRLMTRRRGKLSEALRVASCLFWGAGQGGSRLGAGLLRGLQQGAPGQEGPGRGSFGQRGDKWLPLSAEA